MNTDKDSSRTSNIKELLKKFEEGSSRKRRSLIPEIEERVQEVVSNGNSLMEPFDREGDDWAAGFLLQLVCKSSQKLFKEILEKESEGWFKTPSSMGIDYQSLQNALLEENFEEADRLTSSTLRKLAGTKAEDRGYVYFSEVRIMSSIDLNTLDRLWIAYSQGKYGFSVQGRLLNALGGRYDKLWPKIGWKINGVWTRYPKSFTWSLKAPEGHMPLINQLRGVRLMDALLNHEAIRSRYK